MRVFERLFGPPNIEKLKQQRDVNRLVKALSHKDPRIRRIAAKALGELCDLRVLKPLSAMLEDQDVYVREAVTEALGRLGGPDVVDPLVSALRDEDQDDGQWVRVKAIRALAGLGDPRAIEPLLAALKEHPELWGEIDVALKSLVPATDLRRRAEVQALVHESEVLVMIEYLKTGWRMSSQPWQTAAERLGELGDSRAVEPLIVALNYRKNDTHRYAAEALGKLGDRRAVGPLIATLKNADTVLAEKAAEALGKLGDPRAVDPLIAFVDKLISTADFVNPPRGPEGEEYERHPIEDAPLNALERIGEPKARQAVVELRQKRRELRKMQLESRRQSR